MTFHSRRARPRNRLTPAGHLTVAAELLRQAYEHTTAFGVAAGDLASLRGSASDAVDQAHYEVSWLRRLLEDAE